MSGPWDLEEPIIYFKLIALKEFHLTKPQEMVKIRMRYVRAKERRTGGGGDRNGIKKP